MTIWIFQYLSISFTIFQYLDLSISFKVLIHVPICWDLWSDRRFFWDTTILKGLPARVNRSTGCAGEAPSLRPQEGTQGAGLGVFDFDGTWWKGHNVTIPRFSQGFQSGLGYNWYIWYIWRFPEMGIPQSSSIWNHLNRIFHEINKFFLGTPHLWNPPCG